MVEEKLQSNNHLTGRDGAEFSGEMRSFERRGMSATLLGNEVSTTTRLLRSLPEVKVGPTRQ